MTTTDIAAIATVLVWAIVFSIGFYLSKRK